MLRAIEGCKFMLKYDKDKIVEELKLFNRTDLAEKIYKIAELVTEKKITPKVRSEVKSILYELFGNRYDKSIYITYEFLETVIGEILFTAFFNLEQYVTIADIMKMTGFSRQWIWQCIKSGKIKGGAKLGRDYILPSSVIDELK